MTRGKFLIPPYPFLSSPFRSSRGVVGRRIAWQRARPAESPLCKGDERTQLEPIENRTGVESLMALSLVMGLVALSTGIAWGAPPPGFDERTDVWPTAAPRATCRPDDPVETGLQGEVPWDDRVSGRSTRGYACNVDLVGQYQGPGAGIVSASYKNCAYIGSIGDANNDGVQVVDASDLAHPRLTATLTEPAMVDGTWESLKVNPIRGLLVGTGVHHLMGYGYISIYDIAQDCAHPRLLNSGRGSIPGLRVPILTHEASFSPDGNTLWSTGSLIGWVSALDVTDPTDPRVIWSAPTGTSSHGMAFTPDGRTMYMSQTQGVTVLDTSGVQDRQLPDATSHVLLPGLGHRFWIDGLASQNSIYVTYGGKPYIYIFDELGSGGVKLLDVSDPAAIHLRNVIKLEINLPEHQDRNVRSASGNGFFGYESHYCAVDRSTEPRALACGWAQSGVRVFDVHDPDDIREIAYYNPPAQTGKNDQLLNSAHAPFTAVIRAPLSSTISVARAILNEQVRIEDVLKPPNQPANPTLTADYCMSPPEFHGNMLFVTCSDNGFMVLKLDPSVYPPR